jgi:hypothetical protein
MFNIIENQIRWARLLPYPGLRRFPNGVLKVKMLRAYHHRAIAIGLPFVLNGLFDDDMYLKCAMSYCHWRSMLQDHHFLFGRRSRTAATSQVSTLRELEEGGKGLQSYMNGILKNISDTDEAEICGEYLKIALLTV